MGKGLRNDQGTSSSLGLLKKGSRFMGLNSAKEASVGGGTDLPGGGEGPGAGG